MLNPGQIFKTQAMAPSLMRPGTHISLDAFQNSSKSKWDEPITIAPILYAKFNVPFPNKSKQVKQYPKSLLDYIKRSFDKCKDDSQKIIMERQLREIIRNYQNDLYQVNWESYPIPSVQHDNGGFKHIIMRHEERATTQPSKAKLDQIKLLSCYNIVEDEKPSKALEIAKKRTEKLEQKLNNVIKQQKQGEKRKQFFIGFSNTPIETNIPRFQATPKPVFPHPTITPNNLILPLGSVVKAAQSKVNQSKLLNVKTQLKTQEKSKMEQNKKENKQKQSIKQKQKISKMKKQNKQAGVKQTTVKVSKKELQMIGKLKQVDQQLSQVAKRFTGFNKLKPENLQRDLAVDDDDDIDFDQVIVGKSQSIEKPYLRITGRPNPDIVRPEPILKKALKIFMDKYLKDKNYEYFISQIKSIRQDLTVQHIKNGFTVQVYEKNLQISLEEKDIPQFKHCQTTLWQLYCQGHYYTKESRNKYIAHQMTTLVMQEKSQQLELMLTRIPQESLQTSEIQQCLRLKRKLMMGNYRYFFDYYKEQNKFLKSLFDLYTDKMFIKFMLVVCKTSGQKVPINSLCQILGDNQHKLEKLMRQEGAIITDNFVLLKPTYEQLLKSQILATKKVTVLMG